MSTAIFQSYKGGVLSAIALACICSADPGEATTVKAAVDFTIGTASTVEQIDGPYDDRPEAVAGMASGSCGDFSRLEANAYSNSAGYSYVSAGSGYPNCGSENPAAVQAEYVDSYLFARADFKGSVTNDSEGAMYTFTALVENLEIYVNGDFSSGYNLGNPYLNGGAGDASAASVFYHFFLAGVGTYTADVIAWGVAGDYQDSGTGVDYTSRDFECNGTRCNGKVYEISDIFLSFDRYIEAGETVSWSSILQANAFIRGSEDGAYAGIGDPNGPQGPIVSVQRLDGPVPSPVPLPAALPMLVAAFGGLGLMRRRRHS